MKNLRRNFERFCFQHRNIGIPNLMLFVTLGSALVYILSMVDQSNTLYYALAFNRSAILQGQIWRLFSYVFICSWDNFLLVAVGLICYYSLGRAMENVWGTLRFNLFYFTGIILMDIFAICFPQAYPDAYFLNLSLFLGYATLYPNSQFLLFFIIPVKAWIFALVDLALTLYEIVNIAQRGFGFPLYLFPLVTIANYLLFFGKDVLNLIPMSWRVNLRRLFKKKPKGQARTGTIPFAGSYEATKATVRQPYTHRCTVCGKTDLSHPDLEFRYCSKCKGYFCYCQAHISNHSHIE